MIFPLVAKWSSTCLPTSASFVCLLFGVWAVVDSHFIRLFMPETELCAVKPKQESGILNSTYSGIKSITHCLIKLLSSPFTIMLSQCNTTTAAFSWIWNVGEWLKKSKRILWLTENKIYTVLHTFSHCICFNNSETSCPQTLNFLVFPFFPNPLFQNFN